MDPLECVGLDALTGHQLKELISLHELEDDLCTSYELLIDVDLWEAWPIREVLQPLFEVVISEDVEALVLDVHFREALDQDARALALRLLGVASHEDDNWELHQLHFNIVEGLLSFISEQPLIVLLIRRHHLADGA